MACPSEAVGTAHALLRQFLSCGTVWTFCGSSDWGGVSCSEFAQPLLLRPTRAVLGSFVANANLSDCQTAWDKIADLRA